MGRLKVEQVQPLSRSVCPGRAEPWVGLGRAFQPAGSFTAAWASPNPIKTTCAAPSRARCGSETRRLLPTSSETPSWVCCLFPKHASCLLPRSGEKHFYALAWICVDVSVFGQLNTYWTRCLLRSFAVCKLSMWMGPDKQEHILGSLVPKSKHKLLRML